MSVECRVLSIKWNTNALLRTRHQQKWSCIPFVRLRRALCRTCKPFIELSLATPRAVKESSRRCHTAVIACRDPARHVRPTGVRMSPTPNKQTFRFRTVFISDIHLGFRGCSAAYLLDFLRSVETETLYLVGDIIDVWSLRKSFFWPQAHNDVIRTILGKAKHGTRVIYIPGNHDAMFRDYDGMVFGNVEIRREAIHETADGRRLLVLHGDEFDSVIKASPLLEALGNRAYSFVLKLNRYVNLLPRAFGAPYWSIAAYLKHKVKNAVK